jgi:hypothetical protein
MIDFKSERPIGLKEAAKLYPIGRGGRPTHETTIQRHIKRGVEVSNGEIVRLEGARCGYRWVTSAEAISRFMARLTAGALGEATSATMAPDRQKSLREAARECEALAPV